MKREGFDHVRVPVRWNDYTGPAPDFTLSQGIFERADFVATNALAAGLAVIINIHGFDDFTKDPDGQTDKFLAIWRQIAAHYATFTNRLAFELLNEPNGAATTAKINPIFARAIAEIRTTNRQRTIFVGPSQWNQISELKNLVLPANDDNLIVTVHCYDPFYFTHQGATWAGPDTRTKGIQFPGPPAQPLVPDPALKLNSWVVDWIHRYNTLPTAQNPSSPSAFAGKLKLAREWSDYYGRPIHVGEFGCFTTADPASRARFYAAFRRACDENRIGWAIWDWSAGFRYWDKSRNQPAPGMRGALFGKQR
jgi:endoglucanase